MKKSLKMILFSILLLTICSVIILLIFLFNKPFNIALVRIMTRVSFSLGLIFLAVWLLYTRDVQYKHLKKYQTENGCYKAAKPISKIQGIVIFCTDLNDPHLNAYVDYHTELGFDKEKRHWNNSRNIDMPHDFIGYNKNDEVVIINTIPYGYSCFLNSDSDTAEHKSLLDNYIKIYICKDSCQNQDYFDKAVGGALVNLCSEFCIKYSLNTNKILLDEPLNNSTGSNGCAEWFDQNHYSINKLRFDVKSKYTPIMMFAEDYFKVLQWFKKFLGNK